MSKILEALQGAASVFAAWALLMPCAPCCADGGEGAVIVQHRDRPS